MRSQIFIINDMHKYLSDLYHMYYIDPQFYIGMCVIGNTPSYQLFLADSCNLGGLTELCL